MLKFPEIVLNTHKLKTFRTKSPQTTTPSSAVSNNSPTDIPNKKNQDNSKTIQKLFQAWLSGFFLKQFCIWIQILKALITADDEH